MQGKKQRQLNFHAMGMIVLLVIQYLLGMITTLYITFPTSTKDAFMWKFAWEQLPLAAHIIVGLLLLLGTIALFVRAIMLRKNYWIWASGVGLAGVLLSIFSGSAFIPSQVSLYSLVMATGFIISLLSYFWGLYQNKI